ncbi:hypothetical protein [Halosolutus gelatinilyticus]|uniref:hypothetical protein n=1 Tax=Halosolutus gelatinilyticus TaxID=2931975 RepID=UPI001FF2E74E|nr:hypothetical protein [Halosolutus gelatinilyticus]
MDTEGLGEVAVHYVVMLMILFLALMALNAVIESPSFWLELAIVFVVAFSYRPIVLGLGMAPSRWEQQ